MEIEFFKAEADGAADNLIDIDIHQRIQSVEHLIHGTQQVLDHTVGSLGGDEVYDGGDAAENHVQRFSWT